MNPHYKGKVEPPKQEEILPDHIVLRYIGGNWAFSNHTGPSNAVYRMGLNKPYFQARKEDLRGGTSKFPGLLDRRKLGRREFEEVSYKEAEEIVPLAQDPKPLEIALEVTSQEEESEVEEVEIDAEEVEEVALDVYISNMTVTEIKAFDWSGYHPIALIEAEKAGSKRSTAIKFFEGLLENASD